MGSAQERYDELMAMPFGEVRELLRFNAIRLTEKMEDQQHLACAAVLRAERGDVATESVNPWSDPHNKTAPADDRELAKFTSIMRALFPEAEHRQTPDVSNVAAWLVEDAFPDWLMRFLNKNADYGDQHATIGLGPSAEFVGLWRKIYKLREELWRQKPMLNEGTEEMLDDIIGTCFLIKHLIAIDNGTTPAPSGS